MNLCPTIKTGQRHETLQKSLDEVLLLAAGGNAQAHQWLRMFYVWAHALDDFVDEPSRARAEAVALSVNMAILSAHAFYVEHRHLLMWLLGVVAAQYEASLNLDLPLPMRDGLRLAGNQVVLAVALLTGGTRLLDEVNVRLWPLVAQSQLGDE